MGVDQPERINHNFPLHTLNWVYYHRHRPVVQPFKRSLGCHVHYAQPASKTRVRVIPSYHVLLDPHFFEFLEHDGLVLGVDCLYGDGCANLGHGEDVFDLNREGVCVGAQHETHYLEGDSVATMLEHLEQSERVDVDLFGGILYGHGVARGLKTGVCAVVGDFLECS